VGVGVIVGAALGVGEGVRVRPVDSLGRGVPLLETASLVSFSPPDHRAAATTDAIATISTAAPTPIAIAWGWDGRQWASESGSQSGGHFITPWYVMNSDAVARC
jgi:hypothetical protein